MEHENLLIILKSHKGKVIGVSIGLLFGILVLTLGFWRSFFLAICICIGYLIGSFYDKDSKFRFFLNKILPNGLK